MHSKYGPIVPDNLTREAMADRLDTAIPMLLPGAPRLTPQRREHVLSLLIAVRETLFNYALPI